MICVNVTEALICTCQVASLWYWNKPRLPPTKEAASFLLQPDKLRSVTHSLQQHLRGNSLGVINQLCRKARDYRKSQEKSEDSKVLSPKLGNLFVVSWKYGCWFRGVLWVIGGSFSLKVCVGVSLELREWHAVMCFCSTVLRLTPKRRRRAKVFSLAILATPVSWQRHISIWRHTGSIPPPFKNWNLDTTGLQPKTAMSLPPPFGVEALKSRSGVQSG